MLFPIVIIDDRIQKEDFLLFLEENGVETRLFMPLLSQPIYKKIFGEIEDRYPVAKRLTEKGFIIGCHPYLLNSDIRYVRNLFLDFFRRQGLVK
jgi:dTDP-4-amino-4,6-dideoxygalactose transaminase